MNSLSPARKAYLLSVRRQKRQVRLWQIALLALLCAPLSVLGDLFASIIKRQSGVKDFGHIMPGHGGIMDRFDSTLIVMPAAVVLFHYLPVLL